jgi:hypothetical protein
MFFLALDFSFQKGDAVSYVPKTKNEQRNKSKCKVSAVLYIPKKKTTQKSKPKISTSMDAGNFQEGTS